MELAWGVLFVFMVFEMLIVSLLIMPMPSNKVRGAVTTIITSTWDKTPALRYVAIGLTIVNAIYFFNVVDALLDPWKPHLEGVFGFGFELIVDCELRAQRFEREVRVAAAPPTLCRSDAITLAYTAQRNAYITGFSLFLFLVLRRLVDIQQKLHEVSPCGSHHTSADANEATALVSPCCGTGACRLEGHRRRHSGWQEGGVKRVGVS
jgi:hypothetical protein